MLATIMDKNFTLTLFFCFIFFRQKGQTFFEQEWLNILKKMPLYYFFQPQHSKMKNSHFQHFEQWEPGPAVLVAV